MFLIPLIFVKDQSTEEFKNTFAISNIPNIRKKGALERLEAKDKEQKEGGNIEVVMTERDLLASK